MDVFPRDGRSLLLLTWRRAIAFSSFGGDACGACELRDLRFRLSVDVERGLSLLGRVAQAMVLHEPLST